MSAGLVNYTTEVAAQKSVLEIQGVLLKSGARDIGMRSDGLGNVTEVVFVLEIEGEKQAFKLPADPDATLRVLNRQAAAGKIPKRYGNDREQARRVAWRIQLQWLQAQLAMIEIGAVHVSQVLLPYAVASDGRTVYEHFTGAPGKGFLALLALGEGDQHG